MYKHTHNLNQRCLFQIKQLTKWNDLNFLTSTVITCTNNYNHGHQPYLNDE